MTITLENGRKLLISAPANSDRNRYVGEVTLNGKPHSENWLGHFDLLKGGELKFTMEAQADKQRGTKAADAPYSFSAENGATLKR
jgi:putative alpha-1,2-mannosidase